MSICATSVHVWVARYTNVPLRVDTEGNDYHLKYELYIMTKDTATSYYRYAMPFMLAKA